MSSDPIRVALERLVELDDGCTADHWHAAITAARAALAAPLEGRPSDEKLIHTYAHAVQDAIRRQLLAMAAAVDAHPGAFSQEDVQAAQLAGLRAVLARWGRPALAAAPEGEPSDEELRDLWSWSSGQDQGPWPTQYHCFARAVLARWGRPAAPPALAAAPEGDCPACEGSPAPANDPCAVCGLPTTPPAPAAGEVEEVVRWLRSRAGISASPDFPAVAAYLTRAAALLEQLSAQALPIPTTTPAGQEEADG